jgi:hypothetical protein
MAKKSSPRRDVISHIIQLCGFPDDSTMVSIIRQQGWSDLTDVTMLSFDDIKNLVLTKEDGSFDGNPMNVHTRKLKGFLLYYNRLSKEMGQALDTDAVLSIEKDDFEKYCGSPEYHTDVEYGLTKKQNNTGLDVLTASEFRKSVKRDKLHYCTLKEDKHFNAWNRGFVATAHMHHTNLVLDPDYTPKSVEDIAVFADMQTFMYAVFEEHLKTDTGKSLVIWFEKTRNAQGVYAELLELPRAPLRLNA